MTGARRRGITLAEHIRLDTLDGHTFEVRPSIFHRMEEHWTGFADAEVLFYEPIMHRFDVCVTRELFDIEIGAKDEDDATADRRWESLLAAYPVPAPRADALPCMPRAASEEEIRIAYLTIGELPVHMAAPGDDWWEILDALGDTLRDVSEIIEALRNDDARGVGSGALLSGALIWPRLLGVHPRARGQRIGLQLLAHGLWALHRSTCDLAVLEAAAVRTEFDADEPEQSPESFRALCRHYARLGFKRWHARRKAHVRGGSIMLLELGDRGMQAWAGDRRLP